MNKLKEHYCSPTTNILVVRFEGMLMQSGGANGYHAGGGGSYGDGETNDNGDY